MEAKFSNIICLPEITPKGLIFVSTGVTLGTTNIGN